MKHIKTLNNPNLKKSLKNGGCGECKVSCQTATKTEPDTPNSSCEREEEDE